MTERKDYYKILGITDAEKKLQGNDFVDVVKTKYRKLALKLHPDKQQGKSDKERSEAEEKFKEVSEAYDVLSDQQKRQEYDNPMSGFGGFGGFGGFDPFDMMSEFGFGSRNRGPIKGQNMRIKINVSLLELYNGVTRKIKYNRNGICKKCGGSGKTSNTRVEKCPHCNGTGQFVTRNGFVQTITTCPNCGGKGTWLVNPCTECHGNGLSVEEVELEINPNDLRIDVFKIFSAPAGEGNLYTCSLCHLCVVSTECRCDMNDTCTVLSCNIITWDHLESTLTWVEPRNELLVADACELAALECALKNLELHLLLVEVRTYERLSDNVESSFACVWVRAEDSYIVDVRTDAESCV